MKWCTLEWKIGDDVTDEAEGLSDLHCGNTLVGLRIKRKAPANALEAHLLNLPIYLQGKMAERSKACDSSDWGVRAHRLPDSGFLIIE